jgi:ATP-dependent DNA helicase RecG
MLTFTELWEKLVSQDETVEIEAKSASDIGKSILETVSAFANEPGRGGGYLILGVESSEDNALNEYKITGVSEPDKIQRDLATQCREVFNIPIRPQIEVSTEDSKTVIVAFIPRSSTV